MELFKLFGIIDINGGDAVIKTLDKITDHADHADKKMQQWNDTLNAVGKGLVVAGTAVLGTMSALNAKSNEFNANLANIGTLIPGNINRLKQFKGEIQDLSVVVGKTTDDLSTGAYQIVSAFGDTADTMEKLEINAKAAKAGLAGTIDAINLTSAVTKAYVDVSAEATRKSADLAFMTLKLGQTTFPELANAIGRVAPLAAQLNISIEEMFNTYATLTGVTGDANQVSTQVAATLRSFLTQTEDMRKAIKKLGYDTANELLSDRGLVGALKAVISTTDGTDESVARLFGSAESLLSVFALTGSQADTFAQKLAQMKNSVGALDDAFREQTEGINKAGFRWEQFVQRLEVLTQRLGDAAAPGMEIILNGVEMIIGALENVTKLFESLPEPVQKCVSVLTALAGVLALISGPILMFISWLPAIKSGIVVLNGLIPILTGNMAALSASFAPFLVGGAIVLGLTAIVNLMQRLKAEKDLLAKDTQSMIDSQEIEIKRQAWDRRRNIARNKIINAYGYDSFRNGVLDRDHIMEYAADNPKHAKELIDAYEKATSEYNAVIQRSNNLARTERYKNQSTSLTVVPPTTTTGRGGGSGNESGKSPFEQAKEEFERQSFYQNMSLEQEREYWEKYVAIKASGVEEAFESDVWLSQKEKEIEADKLKTLNEKLKDQEERRQQHLRSLQSIYDHEVAMGRWNVEEQITAYQNLLDSGVLSEDEYIEYFRKKELLQKQKLDSEKAAEEERLAFIKEVREKAESIGQSQLQNQLNRIEKQRNAEIDAAKELIQNAEDQAETIANINLYYKGITRQARADDAEVWLDNEKQKTDITYRELRKRIEAELAYAEMYENLNEEHIQRLRAALRLLDEKYIPQEDRDNYKAQIQEINSIRTELHDSVSSAIASGMQDGGVLGAVESLGDYMANKFRGKIADAITDALFNSTIGKGFESFFTNLFGGGAAATGAVASGVGAEAVASAGSAGAVSGGGGLAGIFSNPWMLVLGGLSLLSGLFGSKNSSMTIQANGATFNADFATANFKEVTLPSFYMGQSVPSSNVTAPVSTINQGGTIINVNVTAKNILSAKKEVEKMVEDAAAVGYNKAKEAESKWQPMTLKAVTQG